MADEWAKILASDSSVGDKFGSVLAISGDLAVFGAWSDSDNGFWAGSAYVFRYDGASWIEEVKLAPSDATAHQEFGWAVAIDDETIVIGAPTDEENGHRSGAAYVFRYTGAAWVEEAKLLASDSAEEDFFGRGVAVFGDVLAVGASGDDDNGPDSGSMYVFRYDGTNWSEEAKILPSDGEQYDYFGGALSIVEDTILVGVPFSEDNANVQGSVYVFQYDGLEWVEETKLVPADSQTGDHFGCCVSSDGNRLIAGAYRDDDLGNDAGSAYIFRRDGSDWIEEAKLLASNGVDEDFFGVDVSIRDDTVVVGASQAVVDDVQSGTAYVFELDGEDWIEQAILAPS